LFARVVANLFQTRLNRGTKHLEGSSTWLRNLSGGVMR
jgi:hypothetical protein